MRPFRIVVAGHGDLADALVSSAQLICGMVEDLHAVGLRPDDSPESFGERLAGATATDGPILILTDLVGGTPHNVALTVSRRLPRQPSSRASTSPSSSRRRRRRTHSIRRSWSASSPGAGEPSPMR